MCSYADLNWNLGANSSEVEEVAYPPRGRRSPAVHAVRETDSDDVVLQYFKQKMQKVGGSGHHKCNCFLNFLLMASLLELIVIIYLVWRPM